MLHSALILLCFPSLLSLSSLILFLFFICGIEYTVQPFLGNEYLLNFQKSINRNGSYNVETCHDWLTAETARFNFSMELISIGFAWLNTEE